MVGDKTPKGLQLTCQIMLILDLWGAGFELPTRWLQITAETL